MIGNAKDLIVKLNETVISIADEAIPKTSTNPKHPGKIARRPNNSSENIQHETISTISVFSEQMLEEH